MNTSIRPPILHIEQLHVAYDGQPPLASGWSAVVTAGLTLLHGDTGSGKSTLLRAIAGRLPARGGLMVDGTRLADDTAAYGRKVFFCEPASETFDAMTVRDCTQSLRLGDERFDETLWHALVDGFALEPHLEKRMYMLSTGSRRKVGLAAALASGRPLTLLDDPVGALDAASVRCLWTTLAELAQRDDRAIVIAGTERIDALSWSGTIDLPLRSRPGRS